MDSKKSRTGELVLLVIFTILALGAAELILRFSQPDSDRHFVLVPDQHTAMTPDSQYMPGVADPAEYITSSHGIRGTEFDQTSPQYRVLAIGGSTTQNTYLDQTETWTLAFSDIVNQAVSEPATWSGDVGRSGHTARSHVLQIERLIPELPRLDAIIVLAGVNDMTVALRQGESFTPPDPLSDADARRQQAMGAFIQIPGPAHLQQTIYLQDGVPFYKRLALYQLASKAKRAASAMTGDTTQDQYGAIYEKWRSHRRNASEKLNSAPPLTRALAVYRDYLTEIADIASRYDIRLILMTQPTLWKPDMSAEELDLLWLGGIGDFQNQPGNAYYEPAVLADTMDRYNEQMLAVCIERHVECIDLAKSLPKTLENFYDDVHFTEKGSRLVAQAVAAHLLSMPPYRREEAR